jgi:hypothetical protein
MEGNIQNLISYCHEFDIFEENKKVHKLHVEACKQFRAIKQVI